MNAPRDMPVKRAKLKTCKACRTKFPPSRPLQTACSPACAIELVAKSKAKKAAEVAKQQRQKDREKRDKLKRRGDWMAEAQTAFNAFVRARDAGLPCICCGKPMEPDKPGGAVDAGHFRSVGSAPHLRFDERNCHAQKKNCNRPGGTTYAAYRAGLVARIGLESVQALESDQAPRKWTVEELKATRDTYRAKLKTLQDQRKGNE